MGFLTDLDKTECQSMLQEVFDAYKEKIVVYKTPISTFIVTENYNFAYGAAQNNSNVIYTPQRMEFEATIEYLDSLTTAKKQFPIESLNLSATENYVRISIQNDAKDWLENSEEIELDGNKFKLISTGQPRGLFNRAWFDYLLQRLK